jgi:hypothetical protein
MKRLSRHTVVVLLIAAAASFGGLGVAVVASGQTRSDATSDYTVPLGDYTTTTPSSTPTPAPSAPAPTQQTSTVPAAGGRVPRGRSVLPTRSSGRPRTTTPSVPSKTVRSGPTTLAFTGAEPLLIGFAGVALMLGGFALHRRRQQAARPRA